MVEKCILRNDQIITNLQPATFKDLCLAHCPNYVSSYMDGTIGQKELRRIGVKWTPNAVERALRVVGATCHAAHEAIQNGGSANLAGGQHHAHYDFGSGYSVFNDIVIAAERLRKYNLIKSWICIDLDVHQGDGTATITRNWPHVYTFSMHAKKAFPLRKSHSTLDVELDDDIQDQQYLSVLHKNLSDIKNKVKTGLLSFDFIMYQAGVDIIAGDDLGHLNISPAGCKNRDEMVIEFARQCGNVPLCVALGGGYPNQKIENFQRSGMERIINAHSNTIQVLHKYATGI